MSKSAFRHRKTLPANRSQETHTPRRRGALVLGLLIVEAVVLATYWPVLGAKALCFDDEQYIANNSLIPRPSLASAGRILAEITKPSVIYGYYHPLPMISLMLDVALGGSPDHPLPFRVTSLVLHLACTALVVVLVQLLFKRIAVAAAVGLVFGLHPLAVEPVVWLAERKAVLAAFFSLGCLVLYVNSVRSGRRFPYYAALACYVLGLLSKPAATPVPMLMLVLDFWPLRRLSRRTVWEKAPFFVAGLISGIITLVSHIGTGMFEVPEQGSPLRIPLMVAYRLMFHLAKIVWPVGLSPYYEPPQVPVMSNPTVWLSAFGAVVLVAAIVVSLRWSRVFLAGLLIFVLGMAPVLGVVRFGLMFTFDSYSYLPAVGLLLILAAGLNRLTTGEDGARRTAVRRALPWVCVSLLVAAEIVATRAHLPHWKDTLALFEYMTDCAPTAATPHKGLADALAQAGRPDEAIDRYKKAIELKPDYDEAHNNLAKALNDVDRPVEAAEHAAEALRLRPAYADAFLNLGVALARQGRSEEAAARFREVLKIKSLSAKAHNNLGVALKTLGQQAEARDHFEAAIGLDPAYVKTYVNLGDLLVEAGDFDRAVNRYRQAIDLCPADAAIHNDVAFALSKLGRDAEAIDHLREAVRINPNAVGYRNNLATMLAQSGNLDEAISHYRESLRINPRDVVVLNNLGMALRERGAPAEAEAVHRQAVAIEPSNVNAIYNLGLDQERLGRRAEAMDTYRRVLQLDPNHEPAAAQLRALTGRLGNR